MAEATSSQSQGATQPAEPILASHLLDLEEKQRLRLTRNGPQSLTTACADLDDIFGHGGLERGIVVGISAEGVEGRLISLHLLATVLLSHLNHPTGSSLQKANTKAVVIDTNGSFPLSLLAKIIKSRILAERSVSATRSVQTGNYTHGPEAKGKASGTPNVESEVQRCLEMVALSRVFDIEGLWEVLVEVGREKYEFDVKQDDAQKVPSEIHEAEIPDSDEETTPPIEDHAPPALHPTESKPEDDDEGVEIIIIDNMTHIINELFARKEKNDAHTLLTHLSHTLQTKARTSNILTILHNTTTPNSKPRNPQHADPESDQPHPQGQPYHQPPSQTPKSLFPSTTHKPSLGQIFTQFPSLHLLLSSLPKTRSDAESLYSGPETPPSFEINNIKNNIYNSETRKGNQQQQSQKPVEYCTVIEILKDECPRLPTNSDSVFGKRERTWCAVSIDASGTALQSAFTAEEKPKRSIGVEVESRVGFGVGNVAKIYGFGGRRV